jgi:nicotinamide-nucleotide amidase
MFSDQINSLATETLQLCRNRGYKIATAESCTGGLIIGSLTEIAGSSDVVDRGFITYSNQAKMEMLGVSADILNRHGAVSPETAIAMVTGALKNSGADITVSVTGIAGPGGGSIHKPVGLVHMAAMKRGKDAIHHKHLFGDIGRASIREETVIQALKLIMSVC